MTVYLQPSGPVAKRALLPGDPKRAMELANLVLAKPLMSNLSRGLWGYHGVTASGQELTVQATGIGAPSATIVLHELAGLGLTEAVRVGSCVALRGGPAPGSVVLASKALDSRGKDGFGASPDAELTARLGAIADEPPRLTVAPMERYYDAASAATRAAWAGAGATVADLCTAALLDAGAELGVVVASALVVVEDETGARLEHELAERLMRGLGEMAAEALTGGQRQPGPAKS